MSENKKVHVVCPRCGSPDVVVDAAARWDFDAQAWTLSSTYDERTCQTCGYESHSFDEVEDDKLTPEQRAHIYDDEDYVEPEKSA